MKRWSAVVLVGFLLVSVGFGKNGEEAAFSELDVATEQTPSIQPVVNVKDMIHTYIDEKGWVEGSNQKSDGSTFMVATGTGIIQAPRGHSSYIDARQRGFDKALVDAKSTLLRNLESEVSVGIKQSRQQGEFPVRSEGEMELSIWEKGQLLINAKLDEMLKEKGIDPNAEEAKEVVGKILNSEEFSQTIRSVSQSYLAGFQVYKTFEASPEGKKGRMGVVLLWSQKLNEMASSIESGQSVNAGKAKRSLREQVSVPSEVLLGSFGVRQTRDEKGNYWLLSSGQSGLRSSSAMAEDMAEDAARTIAESYIRQFAGENAKRSSDLYNAESTKELEVGTEIYKDEKAQKAAYESHSKAMKIRGMTVLRRWRTKHPLTNQDVVGVVLAWSPQSAKTATDAMQTMKDAKARSGNVTSAPGQQKGSFSGSGGLGGDDEDDF